ncbi:hypothetical protein TrRE_jg4525, partial [Triparma retinervis]
MEDCCKYAEQPMFATSSSDRIAFYMSENDEYVRFAEDPEKLPMSKEARNVNFIDFSPDGQKLYFTSPRISQSTHVPSVSVWDVASAQHIAENCDGTMLGEVNFSPNVFRVSPYGENLHYVHDNNGTTSIIFRYPPDGCSASNKEVVFNVKDWQPVDFAFGSENVLFVLAYNVGYKIFKVDLTTMVPTEIGTTYTGVSYYLECSETEIWTLSDTNRRITFTGIEAFDDDSFYVSTGLGTTQLECSTGVRSFYNPSTVYGFNSDGTQRRDGNNNLITYGSRILGGRIIDGFSVRKGLNGHLYVSDYSFGLPWVIDRTDGFTIGRLGSSFGMLIFAHQMAFNPGPFGPRCDVVLSGTNVKASEALTVTVDVLNGNGDPFCGEPHLTAVQSGYTWFGEAPSYNSMISEFRDFKRDEALCHRWHVDIVGEVASLVYEDGLSNQVIDYRLKDYCNLRPEGSRCDLDDFKFSVSDRGDGTYELCTRFGPAGVHVVEIHLSTAGVYLPVKSSPLSVFVNPGEPLGRMSSGMGAGLDSIKARSGEENVFYVQARDSRGNNVPKVDLVEEDLQVVVRVWSKEGGGDGADGDSGSQKLTVSTSVELSADGRFKVCYVVSGSLSSDSDYLLAALDVKIRGEDVMLETVDGMEGKVLDGYVVRQGERIVKFEMSPSMRATLLFESVFLIASCLLFIGLVKYWESENAIKFSQRKFLYIILWGIMALYVSFLLMVAKRMDDTLCALENFAFHLSVWVIMLALGCKTYRTNKIANNKYMKRVRITDWMLLRVMGAAVLAVLALLAVQAAKYPARVYERVGTPRLTEGDVKLTYVVDMCSAGISPVSSILWIGEISGVIYLAVLAHFTRKVPSAFAEAKYIALSIYNIILIISFMAIMVLAVKIDTDFPEL